MGLRSEIDYRIMASSQLRCKILITDIALDELKTTVTDEIPSSEPSTILLT
jgi:hypothetical protein